MIHLQIITPEKTVFDDEVDQVSLPTSQGQITILPNHTGLITNIEPGELIYKKHNKETLLASGFGFAQVAKDNVKVLVDLAAPEEEIEEKTNENGQKTGRRSVSSKALTFRRRIRNSRR